MRPRYVINKGIQKNITAVGRVFVPTVDYTAAIYNPKDTSKKIVSTAKCYVENERNTLHFMFTAEQTNQLKEGYANIEIYDNMSFRMVYRENFAVVRKNSLPITPISQDDPDFVLNFTAPKDAQEVSNNIAITQYRDVEDMTFVLDTGRPLNLLFRIVYNDSEAHTHTPVARYPLITQHAYMIDGVLLDTVFQAAKDQHPEEDYPDITTLLSLVVAVETIDDTEEPTKAVIGVFTSGSQS